MSSWNIFYALTSGTLNALYQVEHKGDKVCKNNRLDDNLAAKFTLEIMTSAQKM